MCLRTLKKKELVEAIETVHGGKMYLDESSNDIILNTIGQSVKRTNDTDNFPKLSRREKEVLRLILDEHTTQEIAEKLFISFGTVETHRRNMFTKTGTRNTAGLVKVALEYELYK